MGQDSAARLRKIPSLTGTAPPLDFNRLPSDPVTMFYSWLDAALAAGVAEPLAAMLATVDDDGVPDSRTLLLKDVDEQGWAFAGLASSRKGQQLARNPSAALNLWWQPMARAVRVRGIVMEATPAESHADLAARSPAAQADVRPSDWRLWRIRPNRVEFWQDATDRRHIRITYTRDSEGWTLEEAPPGGAQVQRP
ncbi:pyridoxine/pyridoxamine 5'-phosphate oxidase [Kocuria sp.]|uniref:pyridoxine/pyridoxamine 5'-phosphate oxidase n=1 Tax=Kocuria sp. TaxID=1871328 RepID=UPI0026E0DD8C|nr:pyridoxamine 5'-phosphate oxidase family protein [Kocuria sp.]MDO5618431.1 pyridoxamine 5'-phosphate oxidase family protein [Kocuria sp.]